MLKGFVSKIKIKNILEVIVAIAILFSVFIFDNINKSQDFNFTLNTDEQIFILPESKETPILNFLDSAEKSVDISIYLFSESKIINKIKKLKDDGIYVRIIIEKTPFGGGSVNYKTYNNLKDYGVDIKYSDTKFALTHNKYIVVDKKSAMIMTSNITYSGLNKDRDFILKTSDQNIVSELNNIFESDFENKNYISKLDNLVVSPENSRDKLESLIGSAQKSIFIYGENIGNESIENLLINKKKEGLDVKIILPDSKKIEGNDYVVKKLKENKIEIRHLKNPYQHAKIIIIDNSIMYLGSINFSNQSMDRNREIGLITLNKNSVNTILEVFNSDFNKIK